MATSKVLAPTGVAIQIPEFTDKPDQRVNSNCIDKEADAINALNSNIANLKTFVNVYTDTITIGSSRTYTLDNSDQCAMVFVNNGNGRIAVWAVSFRNTSEIGSQLVTADNSSSTTVTTSGMTFTVACTYTAKVKVIVF